MINFSTMSVKEQNNLVKKYMPLVNKLTNQFFQKNCASWEDLNSMALEGLMIAFNTYDENKSSMTFLQFAGFAIRNNILTSLTNESRVVKLSNYAQKKASEAGETLFNTVRVDYLAQAYDNESEGKTNVKTGFYEDEKFSDGDVFEYLYYRLESKFNEKTCKMFYMTYGLNGYDELKGKEIAVELKVSEGLVSQNLKKVIKFIRQDNDLCEMLAKL